MYDQAIKIAGSEDRLVENQTPGTRSDWKKKGVPARIVTVYLLRFWADRTHGAGVREPVLTPAFNESEASARRLHQAPDGPTLPAPDEDSVNDPTFRQVWAQIGAIWKHRKTTTSKQWEALVHNVDTFHDHLVLASRANRASGKSRIRPTKNVTRATTR